MDDSQEHQLASKQPTEVDLREFLHQLTEDIREDLYKMESADHHQPVQDYFNRAFG